MLKILATADIHSPRFLDLFIKSLNKVKIRPDLIILAGDLVDKNNIYALKHVYEILINKYEEIPIISVFGNEEYRGFENKYREMYPVFKWLDDEYIILEMKELKIGIIGTRGALDKPTPWQSRHMPWLYNYYRELPLKISAMIDKARSNGAKYVFLVSHYGVTYKNLEGEPRNIWPYLASSRMEKIIKDKKIDLVIHGHIHNGVRDKINIDGVEVYNVSLPARREVVLIDFTPKSKVFGLEKWLYSGG